MSKVVAFLPKLALFGVMVVVGFIVSSAVVQALQDRSPQSAATEAPDYVLAGAPDTPGGSPQPIAFNVEPSGSPEALESLAPADLTAAADSVLGAEPAVYKNPSGFPRIPPISQFDGGPFQGSNCTLTSGAMLARLGFGIVTSGSTLRTLQDDQDGGTDLNDLNQALWRGYGVSFPTGFLRPDQLKDLLAKGYGAVIQGDYSKIPRGLRLQKDFLGGHAIYLDGYYPGNPDKGIPEAYYVIDPLGRPHSGYEGDWWPASVVDDFATAFGGGDHIPAMWAYPPGGVPPEVIGPARACRSRTVAAAAARHPRARRDARPGESAAPSASPVIEPGDLPPPRAARRHAARRLPRPRRPDPDPDPRDLPRRPTAGRLPDRGRGDVPVRPRRPCSRSRQGPRSRWCSWTRTGRTRRSSGSRSTHQRRRPSTTGSTTARPRRCSAPSSMSSMTLFGTTIQLANLDVLASTTYDFQAIAGGGLSVGSSPVGQFTTGNGVEQFDVALSQVASPVFALQDGLSPYLHLAPEAFAQPLVQLADLGGSCVRRRDLVRRRGLLRGPRTVVPPWTPAARRRRSPTRCRGSTPTASLIRAFPAEEGTTTDGDVSLEGVLEAAGPAPSGEVGVGCLASGLTYHIVLDAVGDDRGILASADVTVP